MNRKGFAPIYILLIIAGIFVLGGIIIWWSYRPQSLLVGTWERKSGILGEEIFEVRWDGTINLEKPSLPSINSVSYTVLDDHMAKISIRVSSSSPFPQPEPTKVTYKVSPDELSVRGNGGAYQTYTRISTPPNIVIACNWIRDSFIGAILKLTLIFEGITGTH